ncbi:barstar family protein [Oryzobacter telluris]|uniref:barstar family protein n=1 Tax=Oryzobacter telluris TaxID=3149179 RepID=UPI00370D773E
MTRVLGADTQIAPLVRGLRGDGVVVRVVPAGADKDESLRLFGECLSFPDWYGHNLDALFDCLLTAANEAVGSLHVVWDGTATLREEHPEVFDALLRVLQDTETEAPGFTATVVDRR